MHTNGTTERSSSPVAYITGGASGIGLAVAEDLHARGWNLCIVDLNNESIATVESKFAGGRTIFENVDVTDYEAQGRTFLKTWEKWHRLDLVFVNAGVGDKTNFFAPATEFLPNLPGVPAKPNELVIDVCLNSMVYSAYLALHFFRQNPDQAGKIVFTSSMCGYDRRNPSNISRHELKSDLASTPGLLFLCTRQPNMASWVSPAPWPSG